MLLSNAYLEYAEPPFDWEAFSVQLLITEVTSGGSQVCYALL